MCYEYPVSQIDYDTTRLDIVILHGAAGGQGTEQLASICNTTRSVIASAAHRMNLDLAYNRRTFANLPVGMCFSILRYTQADRLSDWDKWLYGKLQMRNFVKIPEELVHVAEPVADCEPRRLAANSHVERYVNAVELPNGAMWFLANTEHVNLVHEAEHK